jgi:IS5 family transposase
MSKAEMFGLSDQLKRLSDCDDPLETMSRMVGLEVFRTTLEEALVYGVAPRPEDRPTIR